MDGERELRDEKVQSCVTNTVRTAIRRMSLDHMTSDSAVIARAIQAYLEEHGYLPKPTK